ncbi:MAG: hypothetical protein JNJ95_00840 [Dechloromonas sp.]|nr:hypothetical protein [Dechloromonas sp.]
MNFVAGYGLLAHALIFGALTALIPFGELRARVALAATTMALIVGIAPGMHAFFGTPSLTLVSLAVLQLADKTPSPLSYRPALGLLAFALPFYAASLGLGSFDPYALGYQPAPLLAALLPLGLALWWKRQDVWLAILAIDLAGYASGFFANLWDVLLDPLLVLLALIVIVRQQVIRFIASRTR